MTGATSEQLVETEHLGQDLPRFAVASALDGRGFHEVVEDFKRWLIENSLRQTGGNRTEAAKLLGVHRTYFMKLIRDLGVSVPLARRARRTRVENSTEPLQPSVTESVVTELPQPSITELPQPSVTELPPQDY